jgi:hypothetical protein
MKKGFINKDDLGVYLGSTNGPEHWGKRTRLPNVKKTEPMRKARCNDNQSTN